MTLPLFTASLSKLPIAIVKGGDRRLRFFKVKKYADKFWSTKDGLTFELDDRYEYRWKKTSIYIFNFSNSKPLSLAGMEEIDETLKEEGESELFNLEDFTMALQDMKQANPGLDIEQVPMPEDLTVKMDVRTQRFLQDYFADDERAKTEQMIKVHRQKNPIIQFSGELVPIGKNSGDYAVVQVAHKQLDIVPMWVRDEVAYTKYGAFDYSLDNVYYVQKQAIAFFVLNAEEDGKVLPMPKQVEKLMRGMIRKGQWDLVKSFETPHKNKIKKKKPGTTLMVVPIDMTNVPDVSIDDPKKPKGRKWGFKMRKKKKMKSSLSKQPKQVEAEPVHPDQPISNEELIDYIQKHPEMIKEQETEQSVEVEDDKEDFVFDDATEPAPQEVIQQQEPEPEPQVEEPRLEFEPQLEMDDPTGPPRS